MSASQTNTQKMWRSKLGLRFAFALLHRAIPPLPLWVRSQDVVWLKNVEFDLYLGDFGTTPHTEKQWIVWNNWQADTCIKSIPNTLWDLFDHVSLDPSVSVSPYALPGCLVHGEPLAWSCARNTLLLLPGTGCVGREDMLESSFIAEIPSSHNSFLKTLTGSIIQSSPQDALSYTRGAAWQQARRGEGISVLVCLLPLNETNPSLPLGLFSNTSRTTQAVCFRDFTHQWNFCTILFQKEPFLIESTTVSTPPVFWKGLSC